MCKSVGDSLNMAHSGKTLQKSPRKSRGIAWKDQDVKEYHSFSMKAVSTISNHWPLRVSVQNRRSTEVQARTDAINNNLYLRLFLFFCKAVGRFPNFLLEHMRSSGENKFLLFVRHVYTEEAACALGKNRARWPRCWAFYPYQIIISHHLAR